MEKYGQFFEYWPILWPFQLSDYQEMILCQIVSQEIKRWAAFISYFWDTCADENNYPKTKLFTKHTTVTRITLQFGVGHTERKMSICSTTTLPIPILSLGISMMIIS